MAMDAYRGVPAHRAHRDWFQDNNFHQDRSRVRLKCQLTVLGE
jgi:hypothetical protein